LRGLHDAEQQGLAQLDLLGMADLLDRPANKLSKEEKQRTPAGKTRRAGV
jgi:energy-coupling factor transporter ATP-binding protein EcfA2